MIRAYSSWKSKIQYLKILEYLHLSFIKWQSLQYKFQVSLVLWNHNNGDLAMIQKTNIDTLHKEGKSQKAIIERGGCSQSAVSKHIKCKVDWKEEFG